MNQMYQIMPEVTDFGKNLQGVQEQLSKNCQNL